jgi:hypothetical protein
MNINKTLKKNKINKKEFAAYAGYTANGLRLAIEKGEVRQCVYDSLLVYVCKRKGLKLNEIIPGSIVD